MTAAAASTSGGHARALLESLLLSTASTSSTASAASSSSNNHRHHHNNNNHSHSTNNAQSSSSSSSSAAAVSISPTSGQQQQQQHAAAFPTTGSAASSSSAGASHLHLGTPSFKPHKPSSLSSSASASASEDGAERAKRNGGRGGNRDDDDDDDTDTESEMATSPPFSASFKAAQLSMQALHQHRPAPSGSSASTGQSQARAVLGPHDHVNEIMALLNDADVDEEERIDRVRASLSTALFSIEGVVSSPSRLDNLVLDLLHRHREDVNPTGATFAPSVTASPARRPASIRSFSSSRPWTPSKPPFVSTHSTPGPGAGTGVDIASSGPSTPFQATSPLMSSVGIPPPGAPGLAPSGLSASGSPKPHPGVIGSGSPRASPRPWNRTLSNLSTTSISSSYGGDTSIGSPISSVPPGLTATASTSRPASPSPFGSPRLNVGATEFRPKNSSATGGAAALTPTRPSPWLVRRPSSNASSTNLALANKSHAGAGDDDDDEFSPFGSAKPTTWSSQGQYAAGAGYEGSGDASWHNSGASATSSNGGGGGFSTSNISFADPADPEAAAEGGMTMTPFDLLYSILVSETKQGMAEWTPEQVDEALVANGYDFENTMNAISENGGKPLGDGSRSNLAAGSARPYGYAPGGPIGSPRVDHAAAPPTASHPNIRAGVNVLTREAFTSLHRNGSGYGAAAKLGSGVTAARGGFGNAASGPRSPGIASAGLAGALHGAKVCRYYIAGECRRSDCKFSHDLGRAVCRYWLKGQCAHDPCNFLHDYNALNALAAGITGVQVDEVPAQAMHAIVGGASSKPAANDDFPELGLGGGVPTGPKAAAAAATRGRWSAAVQRNNTTPLALAQKEGQGVINLHGKAGLTRSTVNGSAPPSGSARGGPGHGGTLRGSARIALRAPLLLPTLATGKLAASSYAAHRGDSLALAEQRNRLLARASDAFRRGDFAAAKKWSREAAEINEQFQDESRGAAREILSERMKAIRARLTDPIEAGANVAANQSDEAGARGMKGKMVGNGLGVCLGVVKTSSLQASMPSSMASNLSVDERTESLLDLHGLHSQEAVEVVEEFLLGLEAEGIQGLAYLAIGRERHSSKETDKRRVKVAGFVKQFLSGYSYPFAEWDGVLVVDPCTHI